MLIENTGRVLPFSCEQVFDVAADIERYPDYLPGWRSARIIARHSNICIVEQVLALGFLRVQIATEAVLVPPSRIDVSSSDRRFRTFSCSLQIAEAGSRGCTLTILAQLSLRSALLQQVLNQARWMSFDGILRAYEARVQQVYGTSGPC
jgi:coenzyme Q-binding protein COQ10